MQGRYGHFFEKCRLWVRHVWYIIVSECQTAPQTAVLHRWLSKDCPNCRYPRKVSALGFFVCSHWKCLSCLPDSSAVFLFNLSRIVSSTHRDTDRLGNSSNWSNSDVGRLKHFGVRRSVNSIWISPMWIVTYSRIYFINRPAWLQVRTKVPNWALANRWIFIAHCWWTLKHTYHSRCSESPSGGFFSGLVKGQNFLATPFISPTTLLSQHLTILEGE